eukprot:3130407-Prorocentrum_lima.AAC.1
MTSSLVGSEMCIRDSSSPSSSCWSSAVAQAAAASAVTAVTADNPLPRACTSALAAASFAASL